VEELRRIRNERGWSQQRLADESGVNKATINQVEQGKRSPSISTLERLATAMGVEIADFFPKAQAPLPLEDARRSGAKEAEDLLASIGPLYDRYEALGRLLSSRWEHDLHSWDEKIPAGKTPDAFDFGRLLEWALSIGGDRIIYESLLEDSDRPHREELQDTLRMMERAEHAALEKVRRVFEPVKTFAEFRKIWEANDLDNLMAKTESR
jgi:transcriptional regulator with XRE-family HTH domain